MSHETTIIPEDYKDIIYRATYYLLGKVAPWIPYSVRPNQITVSAFLFALLGCALLYFISSPMAYLYWAICNLVWYVLDALDGIHARLTQQTSEYGAFLDHMLDNIFFLVMLSVFLLKFDLLHPLYVFILLLRVTAALVVFVVQVHTGRMYLSWFSGGLELVIMTLTMVLSYCYPHVDFSGNTSNAVWISIVDALDLHQGVFMKLALLFYLVGIPIYSFFTFRFVRKQLGSAHEGGLT